MCMRAYIYIHVCMCKNMYVSVTLCKGKHSHMTTMTAWLAMPRTPMITQPFAAHFRLD